ncbi:MAG: AzlD domain-containing protein [Paracoccus sp. (in: a-proteobacteria)]|nr:AzlD domain-containing protein [Paracoccus sp. (in: a-proteobacteria)]
MTTALWIAVAIITVVTYLTRALPFMWSRAARPGPTPSWLDALGPAILAAMGVSILLPEGERALQAGSLTQFLLGLAAAAAVMAWRRDAGLATLAGIASYALAGAITG